MSKPSVHVARNNGRTNLKSCLEPKLQIPQDVFKKKKKKVAAYDNKVARSRLWDDSPVLSR